MKQGIDSVSPGSVPPDLNPDYVMGYVDGDWPSYTGMAAKFPNAVPVSITAIPGSGPSAQAKMSDGEQGDYDPGQQAEWAIGRWALGFVPALYCSYSEWTRRQQAVLDRGLNPAFCDWMIAAYPGIGPILYPGSPGHQFADRGTYDEWVIADGWIPGRPHPVPPTEEIPVAQSAVVAFQQNQLNVFQVSGGTLWHKYQVGGGTPWHNEEVAGPQGGTSTVTGTFVGLPQVSVFPTSMWVSVENQAGNVLVFAQALGNSQWGVAQLP